MQRHNMLPPPRHAVAFHGDNVPIPVGKIVCVGRNYAAHAAELGNEKPAQPLFFLKPATALADLQAPLVLPPNRGAVRHELELAVLIGRPPKGARDDAVRAAVAGYAVALDLTLADVQARCKAAGHPWEVAKAFAGSCPISAFVPASQLADPQNLQMRMWVNGALRHDATTALMLWQIPELVQAAADHFTLEAGDIVLTGTPAGVGNLAMGDALVLEIEGVGRYATRVAAGPPP